MGVIRTVVAVLAAVTGLILAAPILLLGLPLWVVALLTRALLPLCQRRVVSWQQIIEFDRALGWKPRPSLDVHCLEERDDVFHLTTDAEGWPGAVGIAESPVVVVGDSHAFGYGTDARKCFFQLNPRLRVKALGAPGYNMVQEVLLLEQVATRLAGKLVVWFVYLGNDLYDNLSPEMSGYRMPFVREVRAEEGWEIVTGHISPLKWSCSSGRKGRLGHLLAASLHRPTPLSRRAYSACNWLIRKGSAICRRAGARLIVMTIPSPLMLLPASGNGHSPNGDPPIDLDFADRNIADICQRLKVPFVPLKAHLRLRHYKPTDDHWNEQGHAQVTQVLRDLVLKHLAPYEDPNGERMAPAAECTAHTVEVKNPRGGKG